MKRQCEQHAKIAEESAVGGDETDNVNTTFNVLADFMEMDDDAPMRDDIQDEMDVYEAANSPELNVGILEWWAHNERKYPRLAKLARRVLAIPASSAAPERNFSRAGYIVSERRNRLAPSNVENILVCHSNYDLIDVASVSTD